MDTLWMPDNAATEFVDHRTFQCKTDIDRETSWLENICWWPAAKIHTKALGNFPRPVMPFL